MSRPICWHCGKQLMHVPDKGIVWATVVVDGVEHRVHKDCKKWHYDMDLDSGAAKRDVAKALCTRGCKK